MAIRTRRTRTRLTGSRAGLTRTQTFYVDDTSPIGRLLAMPGIKHVHTETEHDTTHYEVLPPLDAQEAPADDGSNVGWHDPR